MLNLMLADTRAIAFIYTAKAAEYRSVINTTPARIGSLDITFPLFTAIQFQARPKKRGTRALAVCVYYGDIRLQKILYLTGRYRNSDILAHYYWNYYQMSAL